MKIPYSSWEILLSLLDAAVAIALYAAFSKHGILGAGFGNFNVVFLGFGVVHLIKTAFYLSSHRFEVSDGSACFKKLDVRRGDFHRVPVSSIVRIEEGTRQIGGVWRIISAPTFYVHTDSGERYEVFPATDKEDQIQQYKTMISACFDVEIVKGI